MYNASIKKPVWLCAALYLSLLTGSALGEDITVSYAALTAAYMDHIVAIEKGYILEEGLNVKIMRAGGGTATQTLLSGQLLSARRRVLLSVRRFEAVSSKLFIPTCRAPPTGLFQTSLRLGHCKTWWGRRSPSIRSVIRVISPRFYFSKSMGWIQNLFSLSRSETKPAFLLLCRAPSMRRP